MDEPVDGGERHGGIGEDPVPLSEGLVGGDQDGSPLVAGADQLEEHAGLGLVLGDVGEIIEDQQVELVEPGDGGYMCVGAGTVVQAKMAYSDTGDIYG